jgi:hypothetical protein
VAGARTPALDDGIFTRPTRGCRVEQEQPYRGGQTSSDRLGLLGRGKPPISRAFPLLSSGRDANKNGLNARIAVQSSGNRISIVRCQAKADSSARGALTWTGSSKAQRVRAATSARGPAQCGKSGEDGRGLLELDRRDLAPVAPVPAQSRPLEELVSRRRRQRRSESLRLIFGSSRAAARARLALPVLSAHWNRPYGEPSEVNGSPGRPSISPCVGPRG